MEVGLNRPDSNAVVEGGKDVIDADAAGDTPAPGAGLEDGAADLGSAAEDVGEGDEAVFLIAEDGASLRSEDAVVGAGWKQAALGLDAKITVEVARSADDRANVDGLILDVEYIAIDRVEIAVSAVEIEARELGRRRGGGLDGLGTRGQGRNRHEGAGEGDEKSCPGPDGETGARGAVQKIEAHGVRTHNDGSSNCSASSRIQRTAVPRGQTERRQSEITGCRRTG